MLIIDVALRGDWSPTRLRKHYGTTPVHVIRVERDGNTTGSTSFADFLTQLEGMNNTDDGFSLKLKVCYEPHSIRSLNTWLL